MSKKLATGYEIFPIQTETACLLKWSWSSIHLEKAHTNSCHRTRSYSISLENFDQFHNLPDKQRARELMLQGQWPDQGCEYCSDVEKVGGISDRMMNLSRSHTVDKVPPELHNNPTATEITPTILEVYFNNTCNQTCVYCNPTTSSKINDEVMKYGALNINGFPWNPFVKSNEKYELMVQALWKYLESQDRYRVIRHFHILGGEPFLQKEFDQCLEFWQQHPNPDLTINLITNLNVPHRLFLEKMNKIQQLVQNNSIFAVELTASLDCWGPEQLYVRQGLNLDLWKQNFEYMLTMPQISPAIHSCLCSLTIKTFADLIAYINHCNQSIKHPINLSFDAVIGPVNRHRGLHPVSFGPGVFDSDFEKILRIMPTYNENQCTVRDQMQGLYKMISESPRDHEKIQNLKSFLNELDRRRQTDWKSVFPWLAQIDTQSGR